MFPLSPIRNDGRSSRLPQQQLSWPPSLVGQCDFAANIPMRKRIRRDTPQKNEIGLWVDKYCPISSADLCVAPKKVKECRMWLQSATDTKHREMGDVKKLLVLVGSSGVGKSTMVRVLATELGIEVRSWNESFVSRDRNRKEAHGLLEIEKSSAIEAFEDFLGSCGAGFPSLPLSSSLAAGVVQNISPSIILLEDIPNLPSHEAAANLRSIMSVHLAKCMVPTVLIFSDVTEGKHKPADLERLMDRDDLYSKSTLICQIHPVTKPRMKRLLEKIARRENFYGSMGRLEDILSQSSGDIRHAIMTLQFQSAALRSTGENKSSSQESERDHRLSTFHALGKLLYAKCSFDGTGRKRTAYDPEEILEHSDLGVAGSLRFLEYHSVDFFADMQDLETAYSLFSDAATMLDAAGHLSSHSYSLCQTGCAASVAGRAVAYSNTQPTPNKFRQFSTPKIFDVLRKRRQNEALVEDTARRIGMSKLSADTVIGVSTAFLTDILPAMRLILPQAVSPFFDCFYSNAQDPMHSNISQSLDESELQAQAKILELDDIEDFADSEDGDSKRIAASQPSRTLPIPLEHSILSGMN